MDVPEAEGPLAPADVVAHNPPNDHSIYELAV